MKSLKELSKIPLKIQNKSTYFTRLDKLKNIKLDFDVYLKSYNKNLQRELVWNLMQKQQLVMSIFMDRFIPNVSVCGIIDQNDLDNDIYQVIDGKQRLTTMLDFIDNKFHISIDNEDFFFKDLPKEYKSKYKFYPIIADIAYDGFNNKITDDQKLEWFKRINFFGTVQDENHLQTFKKI